MKILTPHDFLQCLSETLTWCNSWMLHQTSFIHSPLNENLAEDSLHSLRANLEVAKIIEDVIKQRRLLLSTQQMDKPTIEGLNVNGGRLLVFARELAFANDGVIQRQSQSFFNFFGFPAPDTWINYGTTSETSRSDTDADEFHLFCWIPHKFIGTVDYAIKSNADPSLFWFSGSLDNFLKREINS